MSMERCVTCNTPVDTDFDSECFDDAGVLSCETCRDVPIMVRVARRFRQRQRSTDN